MVDVRQCSRCGDPAVAADDPCQWVQSTDGRWLCEKCRQYPVSPWGAPLPPPEPVMYRRGKRPNWFRRLCKRLHNWWILRKVRKGGYLWCPYVPLQVSTLSGDERCKRAAQEMKEEEDARCLAELHRQADLREAIEHGGQYGLAREILSVQPMQDGASLAVFKLEFRSSEDKTLREKLERPGESVKLTREQANELVRGHPDFKAWAIRVWDDDTFTLDSSPNEAWSQLAGRCYLHVWRETEKEPVISICLAMS
jgi:hypothetical protein